MFHRFTSAAFVAATLISASAHAALGGQIDQLAAEKVSLKAVKHEIKSQAYFSVHEVTLKNQVVVREYADQQGHIFAVTWQGPLLPDLKTLLGDYAQDFQQASTKQQGTRSRSQLHSENSRIVIHATGRMHHFTGGAYLPDALPQGLNLNDIQ